MKKCARFYSLIGLAVYDLIWFIQISGLDLNSAIVYASILPIALINFSTLRMILTNADFSKTRLKIYKDKTMENFRMYRKNAAQKAFGIFEKTDFSEKDTFWTRFRKRFGFSDSIFFPSISILCTCLTIFILFFKNKLEEIGIAHFMPVVGQVEAVKG